MESINRIFMHCPFVYDVWSMFLKEIGLAGVFPNEISVLVSSWNLWKIPKKRVGPLEAPLSGCLLRDLVREKSKGF